jgi:hypothetical protein
MVAAIVSNFALSASSTEVLPFFAMYSSGAIANFGNPSFTITSGNSFQILLIQVVKHLWHGTGKQMVLEYQILRESIASTVSASYNKWI